MAYEDIASWYGTWEKSPFFLPEPTLVKKKGFDVRVMIYRTSSEERGKTRMNPVWYENRKILLLFALLVLSPGIAKIITAIVHAIF